MNEKIKDNLIIVGVLFVFLSLVFVGGFIGGYHSPNCPDCDECIVSDTSLIKGHDGLYYDDSLNQQCRKLLNTSGGLQND